MCFLLDLCLFVCYLWLQFCWCFFIVMMFGSPFFSFNHFAVFLNSQDSFADALMLDPMTSKRQTQSVGLQPIAFDFFIHPRFCLTSFLIFPNHCSFFRAFSRKIWQTRNKPNVQIRNRTWISTAGVAPQHTMSGGWIFHAAVDVWRAHKCLTRK